MAWSAASDPHTDALGPMPLPPPPQASSPQVAPTPQPGVSSGSTGPASPPDLSSRPRSCRWGSLSPPWNILPGAKAGPAGGGGQPPGAGAGCFYLGLLGAETHRAFGSWLKACGERRPETKEGEGSQLSGEQSSSSCFGQGRWRWGEPDGLGETQVEGVQVGVKRHGHGGIPTAFRVGRPQEPSVLTVTRDSSCEIWDLEAKQRHALFTLARWVQCLTNAGAPCWLTGVRAAAWPQPFQPLLDPPSPRARSVLPLEKGATFARRMPMVHVGGLGSSWSQKFQWAPAPLAFPLYTHFLLTH